MGSRKPKICKWAEEFWSFGVITYHLTTVYLICDCHKYRVWASRANNKHFKLKATTHFTLIKPISTKQIHFTSFTQTSTPIRSSSSIPLFTPRIPPLMRWQTTSFGTRFIALFSRVRLFLNLHRLTYTSTSGLVLVCNSWVVCNANRVIWWILSLLWAHRGWVCD